MTLRRFLIFVGSFLIGFGAVQVVARAEGMGIDEALRITEGLETSDPGFTNYSLYGDPEKEAVQRALSFDKFMEEEYKNPALDATESDIDAIGPEGEAQVKTFGEELDNGIAEVPVGSELEGDLGKDMLDTAGDAGLEETGTGIGLGAIAGGASVVLGAADLSYLTYEDVTTGSNPLTEAIFGTIAPEVHFSYELEHGGVRKDEGVRLHVVGPPNSEPTLYELFGQNAEELGECEGEAACLRYRYPWEFERDSPQCPIAYCGETDFFSGFSGSPIPFREELIEVVEVHSGSSYWLEYYGTIGYAIAKEHKHLVGEVIRPYFTTEGLDALSKESPEAEVHSLEYLQENACDGHGIEAIAGWPFIYGTGYKLFDYKVWGIEGLPEGGETAPSGCNQTSIEGETGEGAWTLTEHAAFVESHDLRKDFGVTLPGRVPSGPNPAKSTENGTPTPKELNHGLTHNPSGGVSGKMLPFVAHAWGQGAPLTDATAIPSCEGEVALECVKTLEDEGFLDIEIDPLTWQTAVLEKPANGWVETKPKVGTEVKTEEEVKIIVNPAQMPLVIPNIGHDELYDPNYKKKLEEAGYPEPEEYPVPGGIPNPITGPGGAVAVSPAPGTRTDPDASPKAKVTVEVNPDDAPPGESSNPITGPTEPGINLPHLTLLCTTFPFGVPCWLKKQLEAFSASSAAPVWSIGPLEWGGNKIPKAEIHLSSIEPIMEVVRPFMLIFGGIGIVFFFYKLFTGNSIGGNENPPSEVPEPEAPMETN